MQITALGHSCVLLSFQTANNQEVKILVDPWLSDHATGDAMGRFPRLRFSWEAFGSIDGIYISHAHCDHLDPYTLTRIWKEMDSPPVLIIPESLSYLIPLFERYLRSPEILVLTAHAPTLFRGVELLGFYNVDPSSSNEDDVMILVITNKKERVLIEVDARLALDLLNFRDFVRMLMRDPVIESAVFLTTENELYGTVESRRCENADERKELQDVAFTEMLESVHHLYIPIEDPEDLWQGDHILRLIHGQGLTAPQELDPRWQKILFPVRIADRVQAERQISTENGCRHNIDSLTVGNCHTIEKGKIVTSTIVHGLTLLDMEETRNFDPQLDFFPPLLTGPLHLEKRNFQDQHSRIIALLNHTFLPYLHGNQQPPFLHLLGDNDGRYHIRIHYGYTPNTSVKDYVIDFKNLQFDHRDFVESFPDEAYWANDIEDILDGKCDEFTLICRQQFPTQQMRLWECLSTPLLNHRFVQKRVRLHFERAAKGLTPGSWILPFYNTAQKRQSEANYLCTNDEGLEKRLY